MSDDWLSAFQEKLNAALAKGWQEFPVSKNYELLQDYFFSLASAGFFEQKFRGKIANPAHDQAVKTMSKYVNRVFAKYEVSLGDFYPGDFATSTGEEITTDPQVSVYEHRNFHNQAYRGGQPLCNVTITICHVRGKFEFPKPPFVTLKKVH